MADRSKPKDVFEHLQSDLYGMNLTQEQLQNVYEAGTSDGLVMREQANALNLAEDGDAAQTEESTQG